MDARGSIGNSSVKRPGRKFLTSTIRRGGLGAVLSILLTTAVFPQAVPYARSFSKSAEEVEGALKDAFARKNELVFLDFLTDQAENVYPMIPGGKGITEMILSEDL